jgi:dTDP-4-dehydrorhamnose 3,5-epimerase
MKFTRTKISDIIICEPSYIEDERGYFVEMFRQDLLEDFIGQQINFCQDNQSKSNYGVLRGLHYQISPFAQTKLVSVISGEVLDVAVDIRKGSPTFGEHVSVLLTSNNRKQLFLPKGFAHGFLVLSETATFAYKVDNYYSAKHDRGIAFNDAMLNIDWQISQKEMQLSKKDQQQPSFALAEYFNE